MNRQLRTGLVAWALLLLVVVGVSAQGGPAVDWWVISGGGAPSSGGSVALNDTLGQPVIGPSTGSGDVALNAGYWVACIASPAAMPVVAVDLDDANAADVVLTWDANTANARYQVWVSTEPYFDPDNPGGVTPVYTADTTYTDAGAAASLENHYYVVRGLNACGAASVNSGRTGEFTLGLAPGTP